MTKLEIIPADNNEEFMVFRIFSEREYLVVCVDYDIYLVGKYLGKELTEFISIVEKNDESNGQKVSELVIQDLHDNYPIVNFEGNFDNICFLNTDFEYKNKYYFSMKVGFNSAEYVPLFDNSIGVFGVGRNRVKYYLRLFDWMFDFEYLDENGKPLKMYSDLVNFLLIGDELFYWQPYSEEGYTNLYLEFFQYDFRETIYTIRAVTYLKDLDAGIKRVLTESNWVLNNKTGKIRINDKKEVQLKRHTEIDVRYVVFS